MPAEWEPHAATWMAWPHHRSDWPGKFAPIPWVFCEMARLITQTERLRLIVSHARAREDAERKLAHSGVALSQVDFVELPTNRSWTRDYLPLLLTRGKGARRQLASSKFWFNGWARYPDWRRDEAAGQAVAEQLGAPSFVAARGGQRVVLEGGAVDVDGLGTVMTTRQCLLSGAYPRCRQLGQEGVEQVLHDYLGAEHVVWLDEGVVGDDTTGHVDDVARFVAPGVVVVAAERSRSDDNYAALRRVKQQLLRAKDARGKPLSVVELPMPRAVVFEGLRLPASYANFYLCNEQVLVPLFADPMDRVALSVLKELFPRREVTGVYCRDLVLGLGTLHCSTQQEPLVGKLSAISRSESPGPRRASPG